MLLKDYKRLGKISIKARKKSTKNTVTGIVFGLIMLIPIIYFALAFYIGLTGEINKTETVSSFSFSSRAPYDTAPKSVEKPSENTNYYDKFSIFDFKSIKNMTDDSGVKEKIVSEYYSITGLSDRYYDKLTLTVGSGSDQQKYVPKDNNNSIMPPQNGNGLNVERFKTVYLQDDNKYILDSEMADYKKAFNKPIFKYGSGFTESKKGKTEILLSEEFCKIFNMPAADIVGKSITFTSSFTQEMRSAGLRFRVFEPGENANPDPNNPNYAPKTINYIQDFTVIGIIDNDYYRLPSTSEDAHAWVSSASVFTNDDFASKAPNTSFVLGEDNNNGNQSSYIKVSYPRSILQLEAEAKAEGLMIPAYGSLGFTTSSYNSFSQAGMTETDNLILPIATTKIQCDDYNAATKLSKKINIKYEELMPSVTEYGGNATYLYANALFSDFSMINTIGGYVMIILFAFGGIIFFATMLNLYNSVNYSVQVRKNYMGVMRAIGAKSSVIPRLYFFEILLIFLRALPWVLVISGLLSFGIKALIDLAFKYIGNTFAIVISLKFWYFFVTLAAVVALVFIIALAFSQIAAKYASKRPILEVLSDDKG